MLISMISQSVIPCQMLLSGEKKKISLEALGMLIIFMHRNLSNIISDFGTLAIGVSITANQIRGRHHRPIILANIETFNLTSFDNIDLLQVSPAGNLLSVRSQEYNDGRFQINRFEFVVDIPSVICLFTELQ